jgi:sulfate adenylyltransferase subunit 1
MSGNNNNTEQVNAQAYEHDSTEYLNKELLRFTTAGSVDDGKSTMIGRLLYDSKSIYEDQYEQVKNTSELRGEEGVNLAYLTDGLKSEMEQGITIDVAYRYFSTPKRKFIIADTPGHIQYTRNMVTGASTANLAVILVDARNGVMEQTCRHTFIASLLRIPHIVFCINKMDLVDYDEEQYNKIVDDLKRFSSKLETQDIRFIPISALYGDNIVNESENMPWYRGASLLHLLEEIHIASDHNLVDVRFPIQYVNRPNTDEFHDYRGYAGKIAGGIMKPGDDVMVMPSGFTSHIKSIDTFDGQLEEAFPPMSVAVQLEDDLDVGRGDMIVRENNVPESGQDIDIMLSWMSQEAMQLKGKYALRHTTKDARCVVRDVKYKVNINTLHRIEDDLKVRLNDIARVQLRTTEPLFFDRYSRNRETGSIILIDEQTNNTVAAGMIIH